MQKGNTHIFLIHTIEKWTNKQDKTKQNKTQVVSLRPGKKISLQAGQNFPLAGQISLQRGMVSIMFFFIFSLQIPKFNDKELPILPVFFPALVTRLQK